MEWSRGEGRSTREAKVLESKSNEENTRWRGWGEEVSDTAVGRELQASVSLESVALHGADGADGPVPTTHSRLGERDGRSRVRVRMHECACDEETPPAPCMPCAPACGWEGNGGSREPGTPHTLAGSVPFLGDRVWYATCCGHST